MSCVLESTVVHAVINQQRVVNRVESLRPSMSVSMSAESPVLQQICCDRGSEDRLWRIAEVPVRSVLDLLSGVTMLFVVYESDADGIRPVHLYAFERLAPCKVQACQSSEQLRRFTDELSGCAGSPKAYWWECCPVIH